MNTQYEDTLVAEYSFIKNLITKTYPSGIVSIVSDSFDFWGVLFKILPSLKAEIMARDGKVVIRPDSGDPVKIVAGYKICQTGHVYGGDPEYDAYYRNGVLIDANTGKPLSKIEAKGAVEVLWETFGGTVTDKGYKSLDSHIGLIYGDSITLDRANEILTRLKNKGFASNNIVFGIGSYTYQYQTRDTLGFAVKATAGIVNGEVKEIFKKPKTDDGMKNSAKGFLAVYRDVNDPKGNYTLKDQVSANTLSDLAPVFENGKLLIDQNLVDIRNRINDNL